MTREEFLRRLNELLSDVTDEERAEAIRFYEEYLDDAGPEQEAQVLAELGSPEKVAAIIRANVPGSRSPRPPRPRAAPPPPTRARPRPFPCRLMHGPARCRLRRPARA